MATPNTSTLASSAQIFTTHTLPQIRAIHKTLHVQIDEKSARLRTQVGNSYRELLGTADTIVQMRGDMLGAQDILGRMGGLCGRTVVDGKVGGLRKFRGGEDADAQLSQAARLKLLKACGLAVGRLLKGGAEGRGDRLVLAAKVFVLSRLLVSSFSDLKAADEEARAAVEAAKKSLDGMRRRLTRAVEKVLSKVGDGADTPEIIKALSAYSLAWSSGTRDVLRHFLHIRAQAITYEFDLDEHEKDRGTENVLNALRLYTKTLLDVQALVPNKLPEALSALKKKPLLADESLRTLEGLRLDINARWCGEEIRYFTPFIRHDDLDGKQARDMLMGWAKRGGETLLEGVSKTLEQVTEFKAIVELRTDVLQQWIKDGGKARGFDPSDMLDGLRKTINDHLLRILETKVTKLKLVGSEVTATLKAWQTGTADTHRSLWDEEMLDMDISGDAVHVNHEIVSRLHGRNHAVSRAVTGFESWHHIIDNVGDLVEQLKRQRWDNDVVDIEDEEVIEARQKLLSKDDPQLLHKRLNATLEKAFSDLDEQLTSLWQARKDGAGSGQIATYLLRILRDIRSRLPDIEGVKSFGLDNVSSLHEKLAAHVSVTPIEEFTSTALTRKRVAGRALWEGEPSLPAQPSPGAFSLLRKLVMSMGDSGLDLWTPAAVQTLKHVFGKQLAEAWREELNARFAEIEVPETQADKDDSDEDKSSQDAEGCPAETDEKPPKVADDQKRDVLIQWLYDIHLLQHCLGTEEGSNETLKELAAEVLKGTGLENEAEGRLAKTSQEYWKRTSLLFGLLA
ncbi:Uu.00g082260.m01.CDS01 [Anthostomella pinea]|uniref:Conserved oligomeric Golgi complex subunit 1 n=1 Tax=Anthostomella pinea TaxID=933095 RepID=A0AAI8VLB8_9PEZI|nr:Uu.00g082260.m01.CDS01 [Anthostomella pinea]